MEAWRNETNLETKVVKEHILTMLGHIHRKYKENNELKTTTGMDRATWNCPVYLKVKQIYI